MTAVPDGLVTTFKNAWETANLDPALEGQRTKTALAEVLDALPELGWTPPEEMVYVGTPDGNNGYEIRVSELDAALLRNRTIPVTVSVDTDDIEDTLAWMSGTAIKNESTNRWLSAYVETEGEQRELIFQNMPASLQWCVHEYEKPGGAHLLRATLESSDLPTPEREL